MTTSAVPALASGHAGGNRVSATLVELPVGEQEAAIASIEADVFPHHVDGIPPGIVEGGKYDLRFAWSRQDLHAVQALRYRVFCEELGEGLASSDAGSREADERDPWFHHLMICERSSGAVVGTYRLQTAVMAATRHGFYSATLFELGAMQGSLLAGAVEIGRACVDPAHRTELKQRIDQIKAGRFVTEEELLKHLKPSAGGPTK